MTLAHAASASVGDLLAVPNNGNAAAKLLLAKLFAARALAAYSGYASTRKVKTPEKISTTLQSILSANLFARS